MPHDVIEHSRLHKFHDDYYLRNLPVVIRGIPDHCKARIFEWSTDYFTQIMGDKVVPVMTTRTGFLSYERNFVDMPFREFANRVFDLSPESGARYYYKNSIALLPEGHDDSSSISELRAYTQKAVVKNLWISSSGLTVGLHFDAADNLNFQLRGHKAFVLYPPGTENYYPLSMFSQTANISGVYRNGPDPDLSKFPRFDPNRGIRIELKQGEVLYIPAYWWHQVESLGRENLNLNFWWFPKLSKQVTNWNQAMRGHVQAALRYMKYGNFQQAPADKR